jgi:uncharacterized protein with PIN domain
MPDQIDDSQTKLTAEQRERSRLILERTRQEITEAAGADPLAEFSIRRYIYIRLQYDERGNPAQRKKLKMKLFDKQLGRCPLCQEPLIALNGAELHRTQASTGYTEDNTTLVHPACHRKQQADRNYS